MSGGPSQSVVVDGLVVRYGEVEAVGGIGFTVGTGEVVALLGPNGAGKTSTVEVLEGHRRRTAGTVRVLGFDPDRSPRVLRDRIGVVLQSSGIELDLTVAEAVDHYGSLYRNRVPAAELLERVGLAEVAGQRIRRLSGGQRRRLDLGLGVIGRPEVLFLDEPTTGFDPSSRLGAWDLVESLKAGGTTVLLTTHDMTEAERLADRVIVVNRGRVVAEGTPAGLRAGTPESIIRFAVPASGEPVAGLLDGVTGRVVGRGDRIEIHTERITADAHAVTSWAVERGIELGGFEVVRSSLEDVYLALTQDDGVGAEDAVGIDDV